MNNHKLVNEMIVDFEMERQELIRLRDTGCKEPRIENRLLVIASSVEELKKQIADPSRMTKQVKGGYEPEEIARFYQNVDPSTYRGTDLNPTHPPEFKIK